MCARWAKDFDPNPLIKRVLQGATVNGEHVSFNDFSFHYYEAVIADNVEFHPEIPRDERHSLVWAAIIDFAKQGSGESDKLIKAITSRESKYLSQPILKFQLLTSISVRFDAKIETRRVGAHLIQLFPGWLARYKRDHLQTHLHFTFGNRTLPKGYAVVRVSTSGRTPLEAAARAMDAIELQRAIWNYLENRRRAGTIYMGGRVRPVNKILAGPISTLHLRDGKPATDAFWYDASYAEPADIFKVDNFEDLADEPRILTELKKHRYRSTMEEAFRRYGRTFDNADPGIALMNAWALLEYLTDVRNAQYDLLVRRASFVFHDVEFNKEVLEHLRRYRNAYVHSARSSARETDHLYLARHYVEALLVYHLTNPNRGRNISEAVAMLDLPTDREQLKKRRKLADQALRYRPV